MLLLITIYKMANTLRRTFLRLLNKQKALMVSVRQKSSEKNILPSVYKDIPVNNYTINDFIWQNLDRWPDKTAIVCAETGHGYTYAQVHRMSICFAASLRTKLKLENDDKVAMILPNIPEYPSIFLGILQAGCIASTFNPIYNPEELQKLLGLLDCQAIVTSRISYPNVSAALKALKRNIPVILVDNEGLPEGAIKFAEFAEDLNVDTNCLKAVQRSPKDIAILPFSSGTTGLPKLVTLTHSNLVAVNYMISDPDIIVIEETTATHQSVLPTILPFFHIFGLSTLMVNQMYMGVKLVTMPIFKPELLLQTLVQHKADVLFLVPPVLVFLGKHPAVTPAHLASLKGIICGAASASKEDAEAVLSKKKNIIIRQGYGLTETAGAISVARNTDTNTASVGHIFANCQAKIVDLNTQEALGPGQEGEIWFRGPNTMPGYYNNEAATKETFSEDGWLKTGDVGKYDENKYLYVTDRLKELIKVKGFQVAPAELETIIRTHPKVLDCAVLGIPDPKCGEAPKAFIVVKPGENVKAEDVMKYVNSQVSTFKQIKQVQIIDQVPKSAAGKILKKALKNM